MSHRLPVGEFGAFTVHGPGRVVYEGDPLPAQLDTSWRIGPVYALERHLAGDLVLHGNAVQGGERTFLILGGKGWGKSSLTAGLLKSGGQPVADDVLAIFWDARAMVRPGHPYLKMWPDTLRLAGGDPEEADRILPGFEKRIVPATMVPEPVPVDEILILERGAGPSKTRLGGSELIVHLSAHAHHTPREHGLFSQVQLDDCARLAEEVPVFRLSIPDGLEHVDEAAGRLLKAATRPDSL